TPRPGSPPLRTTSARTALCRRCHDHLLTTLASCALLHRDALEELDEVGRVTPGALERGRGLVGALGAEVHVPAAHAPQLEAARPTDLVELEVPFVTRAAVVPTPDLRGRAGVPHERRDGVARATARDAVRAVRRARRFGGAVEGSRVVPLRV